MSMSNSPIMSVTESPRNIREAALKNRKTKKVATMTKPTSKSGIGDDCGGGGRRSWVFQNRCLLEVRLHAD